MSGTAVTSTSSIRAAITASLQGSAEDQEEDWETVKLFSSSYYSSKFDLDNEVKLLTQSYYLSKLEFN